MNRVHNLICSSRRWATVVERDLLPWGLDGVEVGEDVLEAGPGFGATTKILARREGHLTVLELEPSYCERLRRALGDRATVTQGDITSMPFEDASFTGVVCFTMLHHLHAPEIQDRAFAEVLRVLRPGGVFAGTDSVGTGTFFRLLHVGDTLTPIDPDGLPERLERCGFERARAQIARSSFRFRAFRPLAAAA